MSYRRSKKHEYPDTWDFELEKEGNRLTEEVSLEPIFNLPIENTGGDLTMLKYNFEVIKNANIENRSQLSVVVGNTRSEISRTEIEEQPNFDKIEYLEDYKINKSLTNYLFMGGKVSVRYEFDESDNISQRDSG